jgi:Glycosyl transferase family 2
MAVVRIFLPTYRRGQLLERAAESLLKQSFADWVCELHNDDPGDPGPGRLVERLGDARISLRQHSRNLGATATFNLFFLPIHEAFSSILEDDNWWEPDFLATLLETAAAHPDVTVFWANMRIWQEEPNGTWRDTGRLVQPYREGNAPRRIAWGQTAQLGGALHSNGAALIRSRADQQFVIPPVPLAVIEMFRERIFPHPMVFVPRPLANFSLTLQTARSPDRAEWAAMQALLAAAFLKHAHYDDSQLAALWQEARAEKPPRSTTLLLASLITPSGRRLRRPARVGDWLLLLRGALRRPAVLWRALNVRRGHQNWWDFLDRSTAARFAERKNQDLRP